jgi:predicted PurR-regulated permease PerM
MRSEPPAGVLTWLITVVTTCFLLFLFQKVLWLVVPVLLALVLYYCLRPLLQALVRAGLKHRAAAIALAGMLFLVTVLAMILFLPVVASHAAGWKETMMRYGKGGLNFVEKTKELLEQKLPVLKRSALFGGAPDLDAITGQFAEKYLSSFLLQMVHWLPSLLLMPYLTYFLLQDGNRFKKYLIHSVPNAFFEKTLLLVDRIDVSLQNFFVGLMKLTFLDTVCLAFGLWILGISFPLLLGLIAAVFAWVPYVGSAAGCVLVALVAATDFPTQPEITYGCILLFLAVRLLDDFVFLPLTVGRGLRIHPVLSVLMLFLGAAVAGPTGLVLVLPVWGVVTLIVETLGQIVNDPRLMQRYRQAKQLRMRLADTV